MRIVFILLTIIGGLLIVGCDSVQVKQEIQEKYNKINSDGNKGFCLYLGGDGVYPYTSTHTPVPTGSGLHIEMNDTLNKKLHIYAQVGLFSEDPAGEDAGEPIYRYDLTELGKQYIYRTRQYDAFCFGRIIVDDVVIGGARENTLGQTIKNVTVKYHIDNIPEWVTNNYELLASISRSYFKELLYNGNYPSAAELIKTPNGWAIGSVDGRIMY